MSGHRYYVLNKPQNTVTACSDQKDRCVMDHLPKELAAGLHPVGRLDKNTEGLLLLTTNGALDKALMEPACHVQKTYFLYAFGSPSDQDILRLQNGVPLHKGNFSKPARVRLIKRLTVKEIEGFLPESQRASFMKNPNGSVFSAEISITEGKKHQIKEMLKAVHCTVAYLKRVSVGEITLEAELLPGQFRECTKTELAYIQKMLLKTE